jgi:hypothetical protein
VSRFWKERMIRSSKVSAFPSVAPGVAFTQENTRASSFYYPWPNGDSRESGRKSG